MTEDERKQANKKVAETNRKNGTGIYGMTTEQRSENTRRFQSQRWMCLITNYISSPSGLTKYQKFRGIDTTQRVRVE